MQEMGDNTTQHCHRLAPQDRRPRRRPEGPQRGWPIPPVRSDFVGEADKLPAATQPARPILAYPPPVPQHPVPQEGGEDDTERTVGARGVSPGELRAWFPLTR